MRGEIKATVRHASYIKMQQGRGGSGISVTENGYLKREKMGNEEFQGEKGTTYLNYIAAKGRMKTSQNRTFFMVQFILERPST